ncbi:MAG: hypothetical protein K2X98_03095, partial [Alphaproteobacteria bacterium]|nr:hypothetical protein [Alphaproteobacteria bacterium]
WQAFDADGNSVGTGSFGGPGDPSSLVISVPVGFSRLEFKALPYDNQSSNKSDSGDYHIKSVTYTLAEDKMNLNSGTGNDTLYGAAGNDLIHGNGGNDKLIGGSGNDNLHGDAGNDVLWGAGPNAQGGAASSGPQTDTLTGGTGRDVFIIKQGDGTVTITDFKGVGAGSGQNKASLIDMDTLKFMGPDLTAKNMKMAISGNDVVITFDDLKNPGHTIPDTTVILQGMANLINTIDNIPDGARNLGTNSPAFGNILFDGQNEGANGVVKTTAGNTDINPDYTGTSILTSGPNSPYSGMVDGYDVANSTNQNSIFNTNTTTFLYGDNLNLNAGTTGAGASLGGADVLNLVATNITGKAEVHSGNGNDIIRSDLNTNKLFADNGNDIVEATGTKNSLYGYQGNDILTANNKASTNDLHGEQGNDILLSNGSKTLFSGGVGNDIMQAYKVDGSTQNNTFLSDSRLFKANAVPAGPYVPSPELAPKGYSGSKAFLEGGHDVAHGTGNDTLELRGDGWAIKIGNTTLTAADFASGTYTLSDADAKGVAYVKMSGSSNASENGLHTISFDGIKQIKLVDASLSTSPVALTQGNDKLTFGTNTNTNISLTNKNDVVYTGDGNKIVSTGAGDDVIIGGKGAITVQMGNGNDTFVAHDDTFKATGTHYDIQGGTGDNAIDLGALKGNWTLALDGSSTTQTFSNATDGGVLNLAVTKGTITYEGNTLAFQDVSKIIY